MKLWDANLQVNNKNSFTHPHTHFAFMVLEYITIYDPYARVCVPDKVKNINVKVFHPMLKVNETKLLVQHKLCECKCRLNESVCNSKTTMESWWMSARM